MNNINADMARAMIAQMSFQRSTLSHHLSGQLVILEGTSDARNLVVVERLVGRAVAGSVSCYGPRKSRLSKEEIARMDGEFTSIKMVLGDVNEVVQYGPYVNVLLGVAAELKLASPFLQERGRPWFPMTEEQEKVGVVTQGQMIEELLRRVGREAKTAKVQAAARRWRKQAWDDFDSAAKYIDACFDVSPSLYVLRMNLGFWGLLPLAYGSQHFPFQREIIKAAFARLVKKLAHPRFDAVAGYMARLDYGREKGLFFHAVFFLRGKEGANAIEWAQRIGDIWQQAVPADVVSVTGRLSLAGRGAWRGCNWLFAEQKWTGGPVVETVNGKKLADRLMLKQMVLPYVALSSLYGKVKGKPRERVFFRGTMPKPDEAVSKKGRGQKGAEAPTEKKA